MISLAFRVCLQAVRKSRKQQYGRTILTNHVLHVMPVTRLAASNHQAEQTPSNENTVINIIKDLKEDCISTKRISYSLLSKIMEDVSKGSSQSIEYNDKLFLLECCGNLLPDRNKTERMEIFNKLWLMFTKESAINNEMIQIYFQIHQENESPVKESEFEAFAAKQTQKYLDQLISINCEVGNITRALETLGEMRQLNIPIDEVVFNSLIIGFSKQQNLKECENVLETMTTIGLVPSLETYTRLLRAYIENRESIKSVELLRNKLNLLNHIQKLYLIRACVMSSNCTILEQLLNSLPDFIKHDNSINAYIQNLIIELIYLHKFDEVCQIIALLPMPIFSTNQDTDQYGNFVIQDYIKTGASIGELRKICQLLKESNKNVFSFSVALENSLHLKMPIEYSLELYRALHQNSSNKLKCHLFWPVLLQAYSTEGESGVLHILGLMKNEFKIVIRKETYLMHVFPKLKLNLADPQRLIKKLFDMKFELAEFLVPLLQDQLRANKVRDCIQILQNHQTKINFSLLNYDLIRNIGNKNLIQLLKLIFDRNTNKSDDICGKILIDAVNLNVNRNLIEKLIEDYADQSIKISNATADYLANQNLNTLKLAIDRNIKFTNDLIQHPRDMNLNDMEYHLVELESKNMNTRGILRKLLQQSLRENRTDKAEKYKHELMKLNFKLSPGIICSFIEVSLRQRNITELNELFEKYYLSNESTDLELNIDDYKLIDYCCLLLENGEKLSKIKKILKLHADRKDVNFNQTVTKNLWNLLNIASKRFTSKDVEELLLYLNQLKYAKLDNSVLLGPIVRSCIQEQNMKLAVEKYIQFTREHRKTPLQLEIISKLIEIANSSTMDYGMSAAEAKQYLEQVILVTSKIHGNQNTNLNLLLGTIQAGTENQIKKLILQPNFGLNKENFMKHVQFLLKSNVESTIELLLKFGKCLSRYSSYSNQLNISDDEIYKTILRFYDQTNKCTDAINFFYLLVDESEYKASKDFIRTLTDLLKRNNYEIPSRLFTYAK